MLSNTLSQLLCCLFCIFIVFIILHFYIIYCNKDYSLDKTPIQSKNNIIYSLIDSINYKQQQFFNNQ